MLPDTYLHGIELENARKGKANLREKIDEIDGYTAELVTARDGKANLNARLDEIDTKLDDVIYQIGVQLENYKQYIPNMLTTDRSTWDWSYAFQAASESIKFTGGTIIFPAQEILVFKNIVTFYSNTTIDFNGCTVIWNGTTVTGNGTTRALGVFNVAGTLSTTSYSIASVQFENPDKTIWSDQEFTYDGEITLTTDQHGYVVGDWIVFDISIDGGIYNSTKLTTKDIKLVKITRINGSTLYINYTNPFDIPSTGFAGTVKKCTPIENICIKNLKFIDELIITEPKDPVNTYPNRDSFVCGFVINYGVNINIENIYGKNTKFPLFSIKNSRRIKINTGYLDSPAIVGPGEGYFVQYNNCVNTESLNLHGENGRHLVDFTNSAFSVLKRSSGNNFYGTTFQMHGVYEHNIVYEDCVGNFNTKSGESFGDANMHVYFKRCQGWLAMGFSEYFFIENCRFRLNKAPTCLKAIDSQITWYAYYTYTPDMRVPKNRRKIEFENCIVDIYSDGSSTMISNYDSISIRGGKLTDLKNTGSFLIDFKDIATIVIREVELSGIKFRIKLSDGEKTAFYYLNNKGSLAPDYYHITAKETVNGIIYAEIVGNNIITCKLDNSRFDFVRLPSNDSNTNTKTTLVMKNNYFYKANILTEKTSSSDVVILQNNVEKDCLKTTDNTVYKFVDSNISYT